MAQSEIRKKELDRIRHWISRAEKRGYFVPQDLRSQLPSMSTQKLKALTEAKLYEMSTLITAEGEEVGGLQARYQERQERAKKSAQTQKANRASAREFYGGNELKSERPIVYPTPEPYGTTLDTGLDYDTEPDETDDVYYYKANFTGLERIPVEQAEAADFLFDTQTGEYIAVGNVIYKNLTDLISQFSSTGKEYLNNLLKSEIGNYGEEAVINAINQMPPETITGIQQVLWYLGKQAEDIEDISGYISPDETHRRLKEFADIILATIPDKARAKNVGRIIDTL